MHICDTYYCDYLTHTAFCFYRVHAVMENLEKSWDWNDWFPGLEKSWKSFKKCKKVMENANIPPPKKRHSGQMQNVIFSVIFLCTHTTDAFCVQGWLLKGHGISLCYHGKVMEKIMEFKGSERAWTLSILNWFSVKYRFHSPIMSFLPQNHLALLKDRFLKIMHLKRVKTCCLFLQTIDSNNSFTLIENNFRFCMLAKFELKVTVLWTKCIQLWPLNWIIGEAWGSPSLLLVW